MTILFIDVSLHDRTRRGGPLDWAAIAAAGYGHIMAARVTYGDPSGFNPSSPYGLEMMRGAKAAGFTYRFGYHNLIHGDQASINRQVDYLRAALDACDGTGGMADIEPYDELKNNGLWPRWTDVQRFHDRWYAVESRPMLWYISHWVWSGWLGSPDLRGLRGPLTNANYTAGYGDGGPGWFSYGGRVPDILQYSSTVNVPGASADTDVNAFRGTLAQFGALLGGDDMPTAEEIANAVWAHQSTNGVSLNNFVSTLWNRVLPDEAGRLNAITAALAAMGPKLDELLTRAQNDDDTTVVLPPEGLAALTELKTMVAALPQETAAAVIEEIAS